MGGGDSRVGGWGRGYLALDCCAQVTDKRDKQRISIVCIAVELKWEKLGKDIAHELWE